MQRTNLNALLEWAQNGGELRGASRLRAFNPQLSEGDAELVYRLKREHDYTTRGAVAYLRLGAIADVFASERD